MSPHWLKIQQRIEYEVLSITYTKLFSLDSLFISTAFSVFNLTVGYN